MTLSGEDFPAVTNIECELLIEQIVEQGGYPLEESCQGFRLAFLRPDGQVAGQGFSCFCGNLTRVAVPYDPDHQPLQAATVCIECDGVTRWPRFRKEAS